ncbi:MAG TPA: hypothetical protein VGN77_07675, partial [Steroidobacteraceae bacterium]|nr:hypothetical protein [Steroidobacteraceae bacterium]
KPDYVADVDEAQPAPSAADTRPVVVDRIKQALVTARLTLGGQNTGADPYDTRRDRRRAPVWGTRRR